MFDEYFEKNQEIIEKELKDSQFPYTAKALVSFYEKSKSINTIVTESNFEKDYYPCVILFRCLIEHFIVNTYIWIQFRITNKDDVARNYFEEYLIYEMLKKINYSKKNNIPMSSRIAIAFKKIYDLLFEKQIFNQKDIQKLNVKANQFDVRMISNFFDKNLPLEFDNIIKAKTIKSYLEYYNYFSSFVHGGPSADGMTTKEFKANFINEANDFVSRFSFLIGIQRMYIFYFLLMNNKDFEADFKLEMEKFEKSVINQD